MMRLYDRRSPIKWYYGGVMTPHQMRAMPKYKMLFTEACVLFEDGRGTCFTFRSLKYLKSKYGITNPDPLNAIDELEERVKEFTIPVNVRDLKNNLEITDGAVFDLSFMMMDTVESTEVIGDALFENMMTIAETGDTVDNHYSEMEMLESTVFELLSMVGDLQNEIDSMKGGE